LSKKEKKSGTLAGLQGDKEAEGEEKGGPLFQERGEIFSRGKNWGSLPERKEGEGRELSPSAGKKKRGQVSFLQEEHKVWRRGGGGKLFLPREKKEENVAPHDSWELRSRKKKEGGGLHLFPFKKREGKERMSSLPAEERKG